jgi:osmoprotectant transport system substrate-binding protein
VALRRRSLGFLAGAAAAGLLLAACGSDNALSSSASSSTGSAAAGGTASKTLVVGGANFTEMSVMEQLYGQLLAKNGYTVTYKQVDNREIYEPALEKGEIDVVPDYAATLANFMSKKAGGGEIATADAAETVQKMQPLLEKVGITALTPSPAKDSNAFAVSKKYAEANQLKTLSDLAKLGKPVTLAATTECPDRSFCQPGLEKTYGLKIAKLLPLGFGSPQAKQAVTSGKADLVLTGTTDATLDQLGLVLLEDDKGLQLADNIVPIVSKDANTPEVKALLDKLSAALTTEDLTQLNAKVDAERQTAEQVAKDYLASKGL